MQAGCKHPDETWERVQPQRGILLPFARMRVNGERQTLPVTVQGEIIKQREMKF